jgi:queuosine precursor transporter
MPMPQTPPSPTIPAKVAWTALWLPIAAMAAVVLASNILVQYPFEPFGLADALTWGAFSYPFAFLVTDLTNRHFGARDARRVVYAGFVIAVLLSALLATPRIAVASGLAFLLAQLLDVEIFDRLRRHAWWMPPFLSSLVSSALDTAVFFTLAFSCSAALGAAFGLVGITDACGEGLPWQNWALFDYLVKLALAVIFILPYGALRRIVSPAPMRAVELP